MILRTETRDCTHVTTKVGSWLSGLLKMLKYVRLTKAISGVKMLLAGSTRTKVANELRATKNGVADVMNVLRADNSDLRFIVDISFSLML